jgi:hypothetical protein
VKRLNNADGSIDEERLAAMRDVAEYELKPRCLRPGWHGPRCECSGYNPLAKPMLDLLNAYEALLAM